MNRATSIYLDMVRIAAASLVFLSHAAWGQISGGLGWQFTPYGREAVDVFFVLSGFVIAYVVDVRETNPLDYVSSRVARIASVALPTLALTFVLDSLARPLRPDLYQGWCCDMVGGTLWQFAASMLFLNEVWSLHMPPGSAVPYWSLGFEVWYYIAFGLAVFVPRPWHLLAAIAAMLIAGPGIAVLMPVWLMGVLIYHVCRRVAVGPGSGAVLVLASLAGAVLYVRHAGRGFEIYDAFALNRARLIDYAHDYGVGLLFAVHVVGIRAMSPWLARGLVPIERPVRWLAGATFTLYLLHQPVMHALVAVMPTPASSVPTRIAVFVGTPLILLCIASVTERRKEWWRRMVLPGLALVFPATRSAPSHDETMPAARRWFRPS
jgi:peptidoglycan/LPS O-acetylase OafA/YrhL